MADWWLPMPMLPVLARIKRGDVLIGDSNGRTEHCKNDSEDEREERQNKRSHQPEPIFSYRGWCKHAKK